MNNHILNLKGISVEKNDVCILEDINLEIKQGDFYPRLGPTHEWDTAAGQCIIEEAGGSVVDKNMSRLKYCKNKTYLNNEFFAIGDKSYDWSDLIKSLSC